MRRLLPLLLVSAFAIGCAAEPDEDVASTDDALTQRTLTTAACRNPTVKTKAGTSEGASVSNLTGCIVGKTGENGRATIDRLVDVLGDTASIGRVKGGNNKPIFTKFTPGPASGALETGLVQDVDVKLDLFGSPSARLRITRRLAADGTYSLRIDNVTPFKATVALIPVTAISANNFTLDYQIKPEANGISVTGSGDVELEVMEDQAALASGLVRDLFVWVRDELAR